jgi:hypothetical protein
MDGRIGERIFGSQGKSNRGTGGHYDKVQGWSLE